MAKELPIGITENGVMHTDADPPFDLDTRFRMVKEAGVFDYYDKTPPAEQVDEYLRLSEKYGLKVRAGGWYYRAGADEDLLKRNLEIGGRLGSLVHNTQIFTNHADGHALSDREVADLYLRAAEWGEKAGCLPTFEVHVNMWSEDFRRPEIVGALVEKQGVPFRMTLDHSHVIFKIDNPAEQEVQNIRPAVESGALVLDPFKPDSIARRWIDAGYIWHAHARAAAPNNPKNIFAKHPDGTVGRGIQYPFIRPEPGQFAGPWEEAKLEPWKEVVRQLMRHHASHADSPLGQISTEFIPFPDYGAGAKYSIFENSVACAKWLRQTWAEISGGTQQVA